MLASSSSETRKVSSAQLEAQKNSLFSLIESGSDRVSFQVCLAGRAPVWSLFRKVLLDSQTTPFVVCQACGKLLKYTSRDGTKSMKSHMAKCAPGGAEHSLNLSLASNMSATDLPPSNPPSVSTPAPLDGRAASLVAAMPAEANPLGFPHSLSPQQPFEFSLESSLGAAPPPPSPSNALTSLTPALSHLDESTLASGLNPIALQAVSLALESTMEIFDTDLKDMDVEMTHLRAKVTALCNRRAELLKRREIVRRAVASLGQPAGSSLVPGDPPVSEEVSEQDSDEIPVKRSRRKQPAQSVRHFPSNSLADAVKSENSL